MRKPRTIRLSLIAAAVACCFAPSVANSNPVGPTVTHGQASFSQQGKLLTVTNSPGSIIHWQGFSIAAGETTRFVQQNAASAVLNRVIGADPSSILGALQSNGRVWLINPNGIIFGAGAQIDTAGLVASTLNVMNADFLNGRMRFGDTPGAKSISNAGEIRTPAGGRVLLISPQGVENSGIIQSPKGEVILAAGKTVEIADSANPEVRIEVAAPEARAINLGKIVAESGRIGIYGGIVVNRGLVSADSATLGENGKIVFRATREVNVDAGSMTSASGTSGGSVEIGSDGTTLVSGAINATGSVHSGGQVQVLGERVGLVGNAAVDVSGASGGGAVLIGGDYQGANPNVRNAQMTYIGSGASIKADATTNGSGGKVIAWADDTTRSHGSISARGGALGGDGGFVETSGKLGLEVTRGPDVRAPAGSNGTWLIDPNNIEIVAGQVFDDTTNAGAPFFSPLADGSVIGADLINAQLDFGSNVVINTTSRGATAGTDAGNITLSAPIVKTAATVAGGPVIGTTSLSFQAHNDIVVAPGGSITSTGDPLNVTLTANSDNAGGGAVTLGGAITTNGASVNIQGRDLVAINAPINTLNANGMGGGFVSVNSSAGTVNLASTITSGSSVFASGSAGLSVTGPVSGTFFSGQTTTGPINIAANITTTGGMNLTGFGINIASGSVINTGFGGFNATDTAPTSLTIQAGATVTSSGATLTSDNMQIDGTVNAGAGSVTLRQNTSGRAMFFGAEAAGGVALSNAEIDRIVTTGSVFVGNFSTGPITINAPLDIDTVSQVSVTTGSTFTQNSGATITSSVPISINASAGITLNAPFSASRLTFIADSFAPNQPVTSATDLIVQTDSFVPVNLGVTTQAVGSLDLTAAQMNNLRTSGTGAVRIGTFNNDMLTIRGPIAPTGTSTLVLSSGNSIAQDTGATITVAKLGLNLFGDVNLPEANAVTTLAASQCCAGNMFTFKNAAASALTIGTVDGINGISNFDSDASTMASIGANSLAITAPVQFFDGAVVIKPITTGNKVDLGGADSAGVLGLNASELALINAAKLLISADLVDISTAVAPGAGSLGIMPTTAGRPLNIVSGPKNPANLEFVQADINNVSAGTLHLGDDLTGPVNLAAALNVPNTIGTFNVQSGDTTTGLAVNAALSSTTSNIGLFGNLMSLNAQTNTTSGNLTAANSSPGRMIDLGGRTPGKLGLLAAEIQNQLRTTTGTLVLGSSSAGDVDVTVPLNITNAGAAAINSGGILTVQTQQSFAATGNLTLNAPRITLNGNISSGTGDVTLIGDRMDVNATVAGVNINATRRTPGAIRLGTDDVAGGPLGFTISPINELNNFMPTGVLRIGDSVNTTGISITDSIAPTGTTTLSLNAGTGSITQSSGKTVTVSNLALRAQGNITLDQNNGTDTVAAQSDFGNINITYFGGNPLNIGSVDGLTGVQAFDGNITLRSDDFNINQRVDAGFGLGNVTITALSANQGFDIGSSAAGTPALSAAELNRIGAGTLFLGNNSTGNFTVSAPVNITGGVNNLTITTSPSAITAISNALTVPGSMTINSGTLNVAAALTATSGDITAIANAMTFGAVTTAGSGNMNLRPQTAGTMIAVGGADVTSMVSTLGLDATDLGNLSYGAGFLSIGNTAAGDMTVSFAGALPGTVSLATGGQATFNSSTFSAGSTLNITANKMSIPGAAGIAANDGVFITSATAGRNFTLGTAPGVATDFELSAADLGKISSTSGTLSFDTSGTITTTAALPFTLVPNLSLSGGNIMHTGGALSASGNITFRGNTMTIGSNVNSTAGGRVLVSRRTNGGMNLGTNPVAGVLGLTPTEMGRFTTTGVTQFGDSTATSVSVTQPITQTAGTQALTIASGSGGINQTAGSSITATNLRLQTNGAVTLNQPNAVGTLAGLSSGSFSFTTTGTLTIGTVDGQSGINDSTVTLLSDGLTIQNPVVGFNTTFAPRVAGSAVSLGGGTGYAITDASIDQVSGFTLNIGNNTTGPINVVSTVDRAFGTVNLITAPGSSITVGAALGSATTSSINMNTGLGGTVIIGATTQASGNIGATGKTITVNAPVTSNFGNVTLGAAAGDTGSVINVNSQVTARNNITFIADAQNINAALVTTGSSVNLQTRTAVPITVGGESAGTLSINNTELGLISTDQLTIGNSGAGDLTVVSAIGPFTYDFLSLQSGGNVTQLPGATITVNNTTPVTNPFTGEVTNVVTGALNVVAGGKIVLPEDNNIAVSVSGTASGTANNFEFNNVGPLKLQNVSGVFATGKVLLNAPPGSLSLGGGGSAQDALLDDALSSILRAGDTQENADKEAEARKDEAERKQADDDKKEGRKSC